MTMTIQPHQGGQHKVRFLNTPYFKNPLLLTGISVPLTGHFSFTSAGIF